jgi:hypothetical protein
MGWKGRSGGTRGGSAACIYLSSGAFEINTSVTGVYEARLTRMSMEEKALTDWLPSPWRKRNLWAETAYCVVVSGCKVMGCASVALDTARPTIYGEQEAVRTTIDNSRSVSRSIDGCLIRFSL